MGTTTGLPESTQRDPPFRLKSFLVRSIMLGVLCGLFAMPIGLYIVSISEFLTTGAMGFARIAPARPLIYVDPSLAMLWVLAVAPLVESLAFPLVYWPLARLPYGRALFVVMIGVLAFFVHGMQPINLVQAGCFMLMAGWYAHLRQHHSSPHVLSLAKAPYWGVAVAHAALNATIVMLPLSVGWFWSGLAQLSA